MLEIHSVEEEDVNFSGSPSFSELDANPIRVKRKVHFSHPLEHWREFDKETGELYELKNATAQETEENLTEPSKNIETCDKDRCKRDQKQDCNNGAKTQRITDVIQAFQRRGQYKRTNASKQTPDKRQSQDFNNSVVKRNVKFPSTSLHTKQLKPGDLLCKVSTCSKLANDGEFMFNLRRKEPSQIQSYCTYSFSSTLGMLTGFKVSPLPLVCTSRKLYDERLLPAAFRERKYSTGKTSRNANGLPPVVRGKLSTPHIVQLFD